MLSKIYQKQVEAWKERFPHSPECQQATKDLAENLKLKFGDGKCLCLERNAELSSRHEDTIELLEAEIERKKGMKINDETSSMQDPSVAWNEGHDSAIDEDIAYLEEELKLIKKEI